MDIFIRLSIKLFKLILYAIIKVTSIAVSYTHLNDNTLTVYIKRIRSKLGSADCIKTIKGIGYQVQGGQK